MKLSDAEKFTYASAAYETSSYSRVRSDKGVTLKNYYDKGDPDDKLNSCIDSYYPNKSDQDAILDNKVVDICDHDGPGESGFYANVIESGDGHYTIAFRGSNDKFSPFPGDDGYEEWVKNNLALLNDTGTLKQQQEAARFAVEMMRKYPNAEFSFVGHSLGGQLATFAAVIIAEEYPEMLDRLNETVNLDGPGYSKEFLEEHKDAIDRLVKSGKVEHLQWSVVGDLLYPLDDSVKRTIKQKGDDFMHDHCAMGDMVLENGHVVNGKKDAISIFVGDLSRRIDDMTHGNLWTTLAGILVLSGTAIAASPLIIAKINLIFPQFIPLITGLSAIVVIYAPVIQLLVGIAITVVVTKLAVEGIKRIGKAIWKFFTEKKLNGNYEVNLKVFDSAAENLKDLNTLMVTKCQEIGEIIKTLSYESAAGNRAKMKLTKTENHLERTAQLIYDAGETLLSIKHIYENGDQNVGTYYYGL